MPTKSAQIPMNLSLPVVPFKISLREVPRLLQEFPQTTKLVLIPLALDQVQVRGIQEPAGLCLPGFCSLAKLLGFLQRARRSRRFVGGSLPLRVGFAGKPIRPPCLPRARHDSTEDRQYKG